MPNTNKENNYCYLGDFAFFIDSSRHLEIEFSINITHDQYWPPKKQTKFEIILFEFIDVHNYEIIVGI